MLCFSPKTHTQSGRFKSSLCPLIYSLFPSVCNHFLACKRLLQSPCFSLAPVIHVITSCHDTESPDLLDIAFLRHLSSLFPFISNSKPLFTCQQYQTAYQSSGHQRRPAPLPAAFLPFLLSFSHDCFSAHACHRNNEKAFTFAWAVHYFFLTAGGTKVPPSWENKITTVF